MGRLFVILLDNAIKYTEAGSINLTVNREIVVVRTTVADTGIGIEEKALPPVCDLISPSFRLPSD